MQVVDKVERAYFANVDLIKQACRSLFDSSPLRYFEYSLFQADGHFLHYSTAPQLSVERYYQNYHANLAEICAFTQLGMRYTHLSEAIDLSCALDRLDRDRYNNGIKLASDMCVHHRMYVVDKIGEDFRVCGFAVDKNDTSVFEYFMNAGMNLDLFIAEFELQFQRQIQQARSESMLYLPDFHYGLDDAKSLLAKNASTKSVLQQLTPREFECLRYYAMGCSAKEAALALRISHRTVEKHIANAKFKYGLISRAQIRALFNNPPF